jgi:hypothetical protein
MPALHNIAVVTSSIVAFFGASRPLTSHPLPTRQNTRLSILGFADRLSCVSGICLRLTAGSDAWRMKAYPVKNVI